MIEPVPATPALGPTERSGKIYPSSLLAPNVDPAVVDAAADGEIIAVAEQLGVVGGLHRAADGRGVGRGPVDGAVGRIPAWNVIGLLFASRTTN